MSGPNVPSWDEYSDPPGVAVGHLAVIFFLPEFLFVSSKSLIPHIKSYPDMTYVLGSKFARRIHVLLDS